MKQPATARFWASVNKEPGQGPNGDCWEWQKGKKPNGYGNFSLNKKPCLAHRFAFEASTGPIPDGALIMHSCDNRACVNPSHLSIGSKLDNARDMAAKGRSAGQKKTHCPAGHEYTPENTYTEAAGKRKCKACTKLRDANRDWRKKK